MTNIFLLFHDVPLNETRDLVGIFHGNSQSHPAGCFSTFKRQALELCSAMGWSPVDMYYIHNTRPELQTGGFKELRLVPSPEPEDF